MKLFQSVKVRALFSVVEQVPAPGEVTGEFWHSRISSPGGDQL